MEYLGCDLTGWQVWCWNDRHAWCCKHNKQAVDLAFKTADYNMWKVKTIKMLYILIVSFPEFYRPGVRGDKHGTAEDRI